MKRLTDKELITALINCSDSFVYCNDCPAHEICGCDAVTPPMELLREAASRIKNVVEPVKCKNCTWYEPYEKPVEDFDGWCSARNCETDEEEFCSYNPSGK